MLQSQPEIGTIHRREFARLLRPGLTVWRPYFLGELGGVKIVHPDESLGKFSFVHVLPFERRQNISELTVNWYRGEGRPAGLICFLHDSFHEPIQELHPYWFGLKIVGTNKKLTAAYTIPLIAKSETELDEYIAFREALFMASEDAEFAAITVVESYPTLPRLHSVPLDSETMSYSYIP